MMKTEHTAPQIDVRDVLFPGDIEEFKHRYPSISIHFELAQIALIHGTRVSRHHSKNGYLSTCQTRLNSINEATGGMYIPEVRLLSDRIGLLANEVASTRTVQASLDKVREGSVNASLTDQCSALGIPLQQLVLVRSKSGWTVDGVEFVRPEAAAYAFFERQGFSGTWAEGRPVLILMHAACLRYVLAHQPPPYDRMPQLTLYQTGFEAIGQLMYEHGSALVEAISNASRDEVQHRLSIIVPFAHTVRGFLNPNVSEESIMALWDAMGPNLIARLAAGVLEDPYLFRNGWPDLTLVRDGRVKFIEIKTTDRLHHTQFTTIEELLLPVGLDVSVLLVTAQKTPKTA